MLNPDTLLKKRYLIIRLLGEGGMGEVYLAEDKLLQRQVAVKKVSYDGDELLFKAAEKEAMVLARLQHSGLPKILDYFGNDCTQYIVMEYIDGKDLGEILKNNYSPFPLAQVLNWADALMDILEYLHGQNPPVIHRDIKPQNIKITDTGKLFLLDFGLVKDTPTRAVSGSLPPTVSGYSLSYAPLEQVNGDPTSVRTDIYGLCATIYHLVTNVKPADALNRATRKIENKSDSLRAAHEINPSIPLELSKALEEGLQLSSEGRVESVEQLRRLFNRVEIDRGQTYVKFTGNAQTAENRSEPEKQSPPLIIDVGDEKNSDSGALHNKPQSPVTAGFGWKPYAAAAAAIIILALVSLISYKLYQDHKGGQEALLLFNNAESMEQSEGLLSRSACAKYKEIKTENLDAAKAGEVSQKSNDCAGIQILFEEAEKAEKDKGLISETIDSYKQIVERFPGSAFARIAQKKSSQFETIKQSTIQAWKEMQTADNGIKDISDLSSPDQAQREFTRVENSYSIINLENVDPILVEHIKNSIVVYKEFAEAFQKLSKDIDDIANQVESKKTECADSYYPDACLSSWLNQEKTTLEENFKKRIVPVKDKMEELNRKDKTIGSELNRKYKAEFRDIT